MWRYIFYWFSIPQNRAGRHKNWRVVHISAVRWREDRFGVFVYVFLFMFAYIQLSVYCSVYKVSLLTCDIVYICPKHQLFVLFQRRLCIFVLLCTHLRRCIETLSFQCASFTVKSANYYPFVIFLSILFLVSLYIWSQCLCLKMHFFVAASKLD